MVRSWLSFVLLIMFLPGCGDEKCSCPTPTIGPVFEILRTGQATSVYRTDSEIKIRTNFKVKNNGLVVALDSRVRFTFKADGGVSIYKVLDLDPQDIGPNQEAIIEYFIINNYESFPDTLSNSRMAVESIQWRGGGQRFNQH